MTREEIENSKAYQVSKAALEYYNEHHQDNDIGLCDAFEAGAEWDEVFSGKELLCVVHNTAERTKKEFIKKACEYFEPILCFETSKENANRIIENFKKAMEECL